MTVIALHCVAGVVAGCVFTVRMLLAIVGLVVVECVAVAVALGWRPALYSVAGLVAVQISYLAGVYLRSVLEHVGIAQRANPAAPHSISRLK